MKYYFLAGFLIGLLVLYRHSSEQKIEALEQKIENIQKKDVKAPIDIKQQLRDNNQRIIDQYSQYSN